MTTRMTFAFLMVAGLAASSARAQDTAGVGGGDAATRSPATTPADVPPVTNRGVIGNERPGAVLVPGRPEVAGTVPTPAGLLPAAPGGAMMAGPNRGFFLPPDAGLDRLFVAAAASSGLSEVAFGRLAAQRGSNAELKLFAQAMVADHTRANNELINLATQKAMAVPMSLELRDRAADAVLSGKTGDDFDRAYAHQQLAAHMDVVALFEAEAERGRDPQLRAWAARMLPVVKDHKARAKRLHDDLEGRTRPVSPVSTVPIR